MTNGRGVTAHGRAVIGPGRDGRARLTSLRTAPPIGLRDTGEAIHLMGSAGGPMGGDDLRLDIDVRPGVTVTVRSVAASVVLAGDGTPSRQQTTIVVAAGATLRWLPEPLVAAAGCQHTAITTVHLAESSSLVLRDVVVLGRTAERPGNLTSTIRIVDHKGMALVHNTIAIDGQAPTSSAVTAGRQVIGAVIAAGSVAVGRVVPDSGPTFAIDRLADDLIVGTSASDDPRIVLSDLLHALDGQV